MPPQLVALTEGPNILLDKPIVLLGRHQECDIQLGSRKVSRRHCCLAQVHDYLVVRDLGSTNGIRINGVRVLEGSLRPGDELTIGNQRYQVQWNAQPGDPVPSGKQAAAAPKPAPAPPPESHMHSLEFPVPLAEPVRRNAGGPVLTGTPLAPPPVKLPRDPALLPEEIKLAPMSEEKRKESPPVPPPKAP